MLEITKQQAESFWDICSRYLAQKTDMAAVRELVAESANPRLTDLSKIYLRLLKSLSNKQGMPKSIGDVQRLSPCLPYFLRSHLPKFISGTAWTGKLSSKK